MKLTDLETKMILNIALNNFQDDPNYANPVWADCLVFEGPFNEIKDNQIGGIVSSLTKKGLARAEGENRDAITSLTEAGQAQAKILVPEFRASLAV